MTDLPIVPASGATMTSIEIAELCEKRHDNVMRDIKLMLDELGLAALSFEGCYKGNNGKSLPCYQLPRDLTMTLVTGYSIPLRKKVIDRLDELERRASGGNIHFIVPQTLPEALRLAADLAEKNEQQKALITSLEPKAAFHDKVADAINGQTVQEVAKILGTGQNRLFRWLREEGILMADNVPYQRFLDDGYFRLVERQYDDPRGESHTYTRTLITGKGLTYIQKRFSQAA